MSAALQTPLANIAEKSIVFLEDMDLCKTASSYEKLILFFLIKAQYRRDTYLEAESIILLLTQK